MSDQQSTTASQFFPKYEGNPHACASEFIASEPFKEMVLVVHPLAVICSAKSPIDSHAFDMTTPFSS